MEEFSGVNENKKDGRRKSGFVLGRRKSRGRSSCALDFARPVENLPPDQQLKNKILDSVKFAAHHVSEELSKKGDKQSLHVLVSVEESCASIEKRLEDSGVLKKALEVDIREENENPTGTHVMNKDQEYAREFAYFSSLSEESKAWDVELLKERKALASSEKAVQKASQTTQVPFSLEGVTDINGALTDIAVKKGELNSTILSLSNVVHIYEQLLSKSQLHLEAHNQKIRKDFEECVKGENVMDIVKTLIHDNYK